MLNNILTEIKIYIYQGEETGGQEEYMYLGDW